MNWLLVWWRGLWGRPREVPPRQVWPRIAFELQGQRVVVSCTWPDLAGDEAKVDMAKDYAAMLHLLVCGHLNHLVQQAIAATGHMKGDERLSEHLLMLLGRLAAARGEGDQGGPVVPADEVFARG